MYAKVCIAFCNILCPIGRKDFDAIGSSGSRGVQEEPVAVIGVNGDVEIVDLSEGAIGSLVESGFDVLDRGAHRDHVCHVIHLPVDGRGVPHAHPDVASRPGDRKIDAHSIG